MFSRPQTKGRKINLYDRTMLRGRKIQRRYRYTTIPNHFLSLSLSVYFFALFAYPAVRESRDFIFKNHVSRSSLSFLASLSTEIHKMTQPHRVARDEEQARRKKESVTNTPGIHIYIYIFSVALTLTRDLKHLKFNIRFQIYNLRISSFIKIR